MKLFVYLLPFYILLLFWIFEAEAFNYRSPAFLKSNPIFEHIVEVSPSINNKYAFKVSNKIAKYTKKYKIDPKLFVAILRQESNFNLKARGKRCGLTESLEEVCVYQDYGISQIYYKTARGYNFDILLLISDLDYSIKAGIIVLSDFKKRYKKDKLWWTRYNCGTKGTTKRDTCQVYKTLVERYIKE